MPKAHKKSNLEKELVKVTKKASKKLEKKVNNLNKAITKAVNKKTKQQEGILAKRKREIDKLYFKATEINKDMRRIVDNLKSDNYKVEGEDTLDVTLKRVEEIKAKAKPTAKDLELMKEYASVKMYDVSIKAKMKVPEKPKNGVVVQHDEFIPLGELRKALNKQVRFAENYVPGQDSTLTAKQERLIAQYAQSLINENQTYIPSTQYLSQVGALAAVNQSWARKNVQIGGYSALLNDLSYTYGAYRLGTEFVTMLQGIMSNPINFSLIEGWYKSSEAKHVHQLISDSVKKYWYQGFLSFSVAIIEAINEMPNLDSKSNQLLADMQQRAEVVADEEMSGF